MFKKNAIKTAEFLGRHSIVFDHANASQANALMDNMDLDHMIVLNEFSQARESMRKSLSASNNSKHQWASKNF